MRLYDCVTFFNELDVLDLRLHELDAVVDRFVIAESPLTFTGKPKPLVFAENRERFARFLPKIEHVVVDDMPVGANTTAWDREWFQRKALARGLSGAAPDDLVLISDVDEIPRPAALTAVKADPKSKSRFTVLESDASFFFLNTKPVGRFLSHVQAPRIVARRYANDPQVMRGFRARLSRHPLAAPFQPLIGRARTLTTFGAPLEVKIVPESAWHFTYLGGAEAIRSKLSSYSHTEVATPENLARETIEKSMADRQFFIGDFKLEDVPLDAGFPASLRAHPGKWDHLVAPTA